MLNHQLRLCGYLIKYNWMQRGELRLLELYSDGKLVRFRRNQKPDGSFAIIKRDTIQLDFDTKIVRDSKTTIKFKSNKEEWIKLGDVSEQSQIKNNLPPADLYDVTEWKDEMEKVIK